MDFNTLIEIIEEAGYTPYSYSGRGMYGDSCVGFTTDDNQLKTAINLVNAAKWLTLDLLTYNVPSNLADVFDLFLDTLGGAKTDSMGRSTVVYFPRVKWEGSNHG
jgi:hypothetical protein